MFEFHPKVETKIIIFFRYIFDKYQQRVCATWDTMIDTVCISCLKTHMGICSGNSSASLACLKPITDLWNKKLICMHFHVHKTLISLQCRDNCVSEQTHTHQTCQSSAKCRFTLHKTSALRLDSQP